LHQTILEFKDIGKRRGMADAWHVHSVSDVPEDTDAFHVLTRRPFVPEQIKTKNHLYEIWVEGTIKRLK
jgi:MarR-like DNA-binding transcriptional regulator SgrR of sgrS sRNA